jgi:hypothetical protein
VHCVGPLGLRPARIRFAWSCSRTVLRSVLIFCLLPLGLVSYSVAAVASARSAFPFSFPRCPGLQSSLRSCRRGASAPVIGGSCCSLGCVAHFLTRLCKFPVLLLSYQIRKLEFSWFQSLSRGGFQNAPVSCSVKCLRGLELIFCLIFITSLTLVPASINLYFLCGS